MLIRSIDSNNRRELLAMGLSVAALSGAPQGRAADAAFDLVIKGGRVIDPARRIDALADVAITGDRIALVGPNIAPGKARVMDASGKLVLPGLIDIHTHCAQFPAGPTELVQQGVTGWIEAGSKGADNIDSAIPALRAAPQVKGLLVNIGRRGMGGGMGDTQPLEVADAAACRAAIEAHRDIVVGVKARLDEHDAGDHDIETLRRAEEATTPSGVPVMIHIGGTHSSLDKILPMLKSGDIVTHAMVPPPHSMFDDAFHLIPEAIAARKRGVIFDVGHGSSDHFGWDYAEKLVKQGFYPDTTSTDLTAIGYNDGTLALPTMMSNLLYLGMPMDRVVAAVTINAANCFPIFKGRGTLQPGSPADVALLELRRGSFDLWDSLRPKNKRVSNQKLFPSATVIGGKVLWQENYSLGGLP